MGRLGIWKAIAVLVLASFVPSCTCVMRLHAEQYVLHGATMARLWMRDESLATRKSYPVGWREHPIQEYSFHSGLTFVNTSALTSSGYYSDDQAILEVDGRAVFLIFGLDDEGVRFGTPGGEVVAYGERCSTRIDTDGRGNLRLSFEDDGIVYSTMRFEFDLAALDPYMEPLEVVARHYGLDPFQDSD